MIKKLENRVAYIVLHDDLRTLKHRPHVHKVVVVRELKPIKTEPVVLIRYHHPIYGDNFSTESMAKFLYATPKAAYTAYLKRWGVPCEPYIPLVEPEIQLKYQVVMVHNTDHEGNRIPDDEPGAVVFWGPFKTEKAALRWMDDRVCDDTDVRDVYVAPLNVPID